jgi:hypothetical protein
MKVFSFFLISLVFFSCHKKKEKNEYYAIENVVLFRCCDDLRAISIIREELIFEIKSNDSNVNENSKLIVKVNLKNCRPLILQGNWDKLDSVSGHFINTIYTNDTLVHRFKIDLSIQGVSLLNITNDYQCLWSLANDFYIVKRNQKQTIQKTKKIKVTYLYNDKILSEKDSMILSFPFMPDHVPDDFYN